MQLIMAALITTARLSTAKAFTGIIIVDYRPCHIIQYITSYIQVRFQLCNNTELGVLYGGL